MTLWQSIEKRAVSPSYCLKRIGRRRKNPICVGLRLLSNYRCVAGFVSTSPCVACSVLNFPRRRLRISLVQRLFLPFCLFADCSLPDSTRTNLITTASFAWVLLFSHCSSAFFFPPPFWFFIWYLLCWARVMNLRIWTHPYVPSVTKLCTVWLL